MLHNESIYGSSIVESIERSASISYAICGSLSLLLDIFKKEINLNLKLEILQFLLQQQKKNKNKITKQNKKEVKKKKKKLATFFHINPDGVFLLP